MMCPVVSLHVYQAVKRELCSISTRGTLTDPDAITDDLASYLLGFCETELTQEEITALERTQEAQTSSGRQAVTKYGICYVDCATAQFVMGEFYDDKQR